MAKNDEFPYKYEFPLPEVKDAPVPSNANYQPQNVAWLIEMFASVLAEQRTSLIFRYENNTPGNKDDDIFVRHPNDKEYFDNAVRRGHEGSPEMARYNEFAKNSQRLKTFMETSPAGITYFQGSESDLP